ncbi:MAG: YopX family protein [Leuconostoc falkenbergense]|uniref:YopX family protein n=1 Tax=Leuconostoc falkenbergense TaxID=2766470 RepID=UPI0039E97C65
MREIKFRAWNKLDNTYVEPYTIQEMIFQKDSNIPLDVLYDEFEFEQYSGLKDKKGVEIYENDILKTCGANIYVVEFFDGKFNPVSDLEGSNWEVIGNIHQDSDLLVDDIERMIPDDIGNDIHEFLHGGDNKMEKFNEIQGYTARWYGEDGDLTIGGIDENDMTQEELNSKKQ